MAFLKRISSNFIFIRNTSCSVQLEPSSEQAFTKIWPAVRLLLTQYDINPSKLPRGSGRHGELLKGDVLSYINKQALRPAALGVTHAAAPAPSASLLPPPPSAFAKPSSAPGAKFLDLPRSELERSLAAQSVASKWSTPQVHACLRFSADRLVASAKTFVSTSSDKSLKTSPSLGRPLAALLVKIVAAALQSTPDLNGYFDAQSEVLKRSTHVSFDVVFVERLTQRRVHVASADRRTPHELLSLFSGSSPSATPSSSATFTLYLQLEESTVLARATPTSLMELVDAPRVACLSLARGRSISLDGDRPALSETLAATLSYDARVIDELLASEFLAKIRQIVDKGVNL